MLCEEINRIKLGNVLFHPWCMSFEKDFKEEKLRIFEIEERKRVENNKKNEDLLDKINVSGNMNNFSVLSDFKSHISSTILISVNATKINNESSRYTSSTMGQS